MSEASFSAIEARASTAAFFISSLTCVAPTSRAPRKMNGKHRTLLIWLGKSVRPEAMTASSRTAWTSSGMISGVRVGERKNQRPVRHRRDHLLFHDVGSRQPQEYVRTGHHFAKRAFVRLACERLLVGVHQLFAAGIDDTLDIAHDTCFPV